MGTQYLKDGEMLPELNVSVGKVVCYARKYNLHCDYYILPVAYLTL
jgi:hypothetical protein